MGAVNIGEYVVPIIGYAGTLAAAVWAFAWKLSGMKEDTDKRISSLENKIIEQEGKVRGSTVEAVEEATRIMGEGLAALRQKATDMELWGRDNYVRRNDFQNVIDSFTRSVESLRGDMNAGYLRLDSKLDRVLREDDKR